MTVHIVELEPIETRYTAEWKVHIPLQLHKLGADVNVIQGPKDAPQDTTPGAFLNFSGTNYWKSDQLKQISELFSQGKVNNGDYFLYTDAWNPTVLQVKYMASLLNIDIKIGGMWHAGAYDPNDFLGRLIGHQEGWVRHAELAMFDCFDHNFFATQFHIDMFTKAFSETIGSPSIKLVGWPMEYLKDKVNNKRQWNKKVAFPHRIAPEKQLDFCKQAVNSDTKDFTLQVFQLTPISKDEYHRGLEDSAFVLSANLQETLGIGCYEGLLAGCLPIVPDRLSYSEMYKGFPTLYPSNATARQLHDKIQDCYKNYNKIWEEIDNKKLVDQVSKFFNGRRLYEAILETQV